MQNLFVDDAEMCFVLIGNVILRLVGGARCCRFFVSILLEKFVECFATARHLAPQINGMFLYFFEDIILKTKIISATLGFVCDYFASQRACAWLAQFDRTSEFVGLLNDHATVFIWIVSFRQSF